jgi:SAM-dependent methyltransferase
MPQNNRKQTVTTMETTREMTLYYRDIWENPLDLRGLVFAQLNEYVRRRIQPGFGKKALDLGSGKGTILAYLNEKGYEVTALELDSQLARDLKRRFPFANIIRSDVRKIELDECFDLVTCIELAQNLKKDELGDVLHRLSKISKRLLINISNRRSFHGVWINHRGFKADFVVEYVSDDLERLLAESGFRVTHRRGIGLLTPVSLYPHFRGKLFPSWVARVANHLDPLLNTRCHLYYVEADGPRANLSDSRSP